jgi:hypothetical protein
MCERTPDPPANVDFSLVNGTAGESPLKTLRERLLAHASDDSCASCHTRTDPIGLALEHFDGVGAYRALDNGEPIDASAQIGKKSFVGAQGLAYVLRDDPKIPTCLVQNLYAYTSGANGEELDRDLLQPALKLFADGGYKVAPLIRHIATSEDTYRVVSHPPPAPGDEVLTEVAQR